MRIVDLFQYMQSKNMLITVVNDKLNIKADKKDMTTEVMQCLSENKKDIMNYIKQYGDYRNVIFKREDSEVIKPSMQQQRLWNLYKYSKGHEKYLNTYMAFCLKGDLDVAKLKGCFEQIVLKHEVLRSNFVCENGKVNVKISDAPKNFFTYVETEEKCQLSEKLREEIYKPFKLEEDSLIRVYLIRREETMHDMIIILSNLVTDGWSGSIISEELEKLYLDNSRGAISKDTVGYFDYVDKMVSENYANEKRDDLEYWLNSIQNMEKEIIYTNCLERKEKTFAGGDLDFTISKEITESLQRIAVDEKSTVFNVVYAMISLMVYKFSCNDEFVLFVPEVNRNNETVRNMIGLFDNLLMVGNKINKQLTVREFIQYCKNTIYDSFEHDAIPFEVVLSQLETVPKFQIQVSMLDVAMKKMNLGSIEVESKKFQTHACMCDMEIYFWVEEQEIKGHIVYAADLFEEKDIRERIDYINSLGANLEQNLDNVVYDFVPKDEIEYYRKKEFLTELKKILNTNQLDVKKSFIEMGGHSLSFLKLIQLLERYKVNLYETDIYNMSIESIMKIV